MGTSGNMPTKKNNPRYKNGNYRRKLRARFKAMGEPCYLCGKPIMYDQPSNYKFPYSLVIDEDIPCSRWREFGYSSAEEACMDIHNTHPMHYLCNQIKSNRTVQEMRQKKIKVNFSDGEW